MPEAWTDKEERQYQHIKQAEQATGKSEEEAEAIAAATVNKGRRERGETKEDG
ncbi:MAG: hypothetical protein KGL39_39040 [Patescibacteria group bacterium]|nr:hypothetical protein [Patescibacteria group bacterium]